MSQKAAELEALLDLFEKHFDVPAAAIEITHRARTPHKVVQWGQSTRIDIFLALLTFRIQFSAWPANRDFSMPVRYIT